MDGKTFHTRQNCNNKVAKHCFPLQYYNSESQVDSQKINIWIFKTQGTFLFSISILYLFLYACCAVKGKHTKAPVVLLFWVLFVCCFTRELFCFFGLQKMNEKCEVNRFAGKRYWSDTNTLKPAYLVCTWQWVGLKGTCHIRWNSSLIE